MDIFSNLSQLNEISLDWEYTAISGMPLPKIKENFDPEIKAAADTQQKTPERSFPTCPVSTTATTSPPLVRGHINPFSLLSAIVKRDFRGYWFTTGISTFLVDILRQTNFDLRNLDGIEVPAASLSDDRDDLLPDSTDHRQLIKVGVEFDAKTGISEDRSRTIENDKRNKLQNEHFNVSILGILIYSFRLDKKNVILQHENMGFYKYIR